jgi:PhnB protein
MTLFNPQDTAFRGVIPYLSLQGASNKASAFYQRAFAAKELTRVPAESNPDRLVHCHLEINGGSLMMTDFHPDDDHAFEPTRSIAMQLTVADGHAWWKRAVDAGCTVRFPLQEMAFGGLMGRLVDPFGVRWTITANKPT